MDVSTAERRKVAPTYIGGQPTSARKIHVHFYSGGEKETTEVALERSYTTALNRVSMIAFSELHPARVIRAECAAVVENQTAQEKLILLRSCPVLLTDSHSVDYGSR